MSKTVGRDRGALAALVLALVAVAFVAWASNPDNGSVKQPNTEAIQEGQQGHVERLVSEMTAFKPWEDTFAQWLMAVLSVFATGASIAAVVLVRDSLKLTREATNAAVEANRLTRQIYVAENRAWIEIEHVIATSPLTWNKETKEGRLTLNIAVKNTGKTLAKNVWISVDMSASFDDPLKGYRDDLRP
jgi:hypothetical protein